MAGLFGAPFCISILKVLKAQILCHSLDTKAFCIIKEYFSQNCKISANERGGTLFLGANQLCSLGELFRPPFCISILKVLRTQILYHSFDFKALCLIQEYFSETFKMPTKRGNIICWGEPICRMADLFGPFFCISILKVLKTQILFHSLDMNAFCVIKEYLSQNWKISTN